MNFNLCLLVSGTRCAGRLNILDSPPEVTLLGESPEHHRYRRSLPIYKYRNEILSTLEQQQVIVIAGDVGSGKTTQVPQYILEEAYDKKTPCRIVSIQPRRLNVLAAVDRVTAERGNIFNTSKSILGPIGYQLFLCRRDWRQSSRVPDTLRIQRHHDLPFNFFHDWSFPSYSL